MRGRVRRTSTTGLAVGAAFLLTACLSSPANLISAEVDDDGRELIVEVDTCNAVLRIDDAQTEDEVRIVVEQRASRGECTQRFSLTLDEPLGDRPVIDATTGEPIPVTRLED